MLMLGSNMPLALAGTRLDRAMPVLDDLLKLVVELAGKGLSIFGLTKQAGLRLFGRKYKPTTDAPLSGGATLSLGLYRFRYANYKMHKISLLEKANMLCHHSGQVLESLHSDTQARKPWFFHALFRVLSFGRGGAVQYKSGLSVKAARRSVTVSNTPITLESNHLEEIKGAHIHA